MLWKHPQPVLPATPAFQGQRALPFPSHEAPLSPPCTVEHSHRWVGLGTGWHGGSGSVVPVLLRPPRCSSSPSTAATSHPEEPKGLCCGHEAYTAPPPRWRMQQERGPPHPHTPCLHIAPLPEQRIMGKNEICFPTSLWFLECHFSAYL